MGEEKIFAHGCNSKGVMGAGFAWQVRARFPEAYDYYRTTYLTVGLQMGEIYDYVENGKTVIHCITQDTFGRSGVHVSYEAVESCFGQINDKYHGHTVAMPMIGAGLAGGDWKKIEEILDNCSTNFLPVVYIL